MELQNVAKAKPTFKKRYILLGLLLVLLVAAILFFSSLHLYRFAGASMAPSIYEDDIMVCQSISFTPHQGDIVVCQVDSYMSEPIIKRVIATGGQHVVVDHKNNTVYVDGIPLEEPYISEPMAEPLIPSFTQNDIVVPQGYVYILGDNRNHSVDSRDERLGCVSQEDILGKVLLVLPAHK